MSQQKLSNITHFLSMSLLGRSIIVGVLVLVLTIPFALIQHLIHERSNLSTEVQNEIARKWGNELLFQGARLNLAFYGKDKAINYKAIRPDNLRITARSHVKVKKRGIYQVPVYETAFEIQGEFTLSKDELKQAASKQSYFSIGFSEPLSLRTIDESYFNEKPNKVHLDNFYSPGLPEQLALPLKAGTNSFRVNAVLQGSKALYFLPASAEMDVSLESNWESPSFSGIALPFNTKLGEKGFSAVWKERSSIQSTQPIPSVAFLTSNAEIYAFGVKFFSPVSDYQKITRISKYALLFVLLTFLLSMILFEVIGKKAVHPVQYFFIGAALIVFYLLLLALSEYISFNFSYAISTVAITSLIIFYTTGVGAEAKFVLLFGSFISMLYLFFFALLQLEEYSLLIGTIAVFISLATLMIGTRKVNWFSISKKSEQIVA